jgi:PEGA domain-containing protein
MCKRLFLATCLLCLLTASSFAQTSAPTSTATPASASGQTVPAPVQKPSSGPKGFVLEDGTPVKLRIGRTVSSADAHVGETVDFEVLEDVMVNGALVIPKGGLAFATVTEAQGKRRMARGGKLNMNIDAVRLANGEKAALRAIKEVQGGGHTGAMTGGIVATSIVFFPAAPFFLFMHGKDISIPKGTEITAYVNGDVQLDRAKFQSAQSATVPGSATATAVTASAAASPSPEQTAGAQLEVSSTPSGAEIEIDGNFVGSTPSTVGVMAGQHQLSVKKNGFKQWQRKVSVSSGHVKIEAALESEPK